MDAWRNRRHEHRLGGVRRRRLRAGARVPGGPGRRLDAVRARRLRRARATSSPRRRCVQLQFAPIFPCSGNATYPSPPAIRWWARPSRAGGQRPSGVRDVLPALPPDIVAIVFDPAQSSGIRARVQLRHALRTGAVGHRGTRLPGRHRRHHRRRRAGRPGVAVEPGGRRRAHVRRKRSAGAGRVARSSPGTFAAPASAPFPAFPGETREQLRRPPVRHGAAATRRTWSPAAMRRPPIPRPRTPRPRRHRDAGHPGTGEDGPAGDQRRPDGNVQRLAVRTTATRPPGRSPSPTASTASPVTISDVSAPPTLAAWPAGTGAATFKAAVAARARGRDR